MGVLRFPSTAEELQGISSSILSTGWVLEGIKGKGLKAPRWGELEKVWEGSSLGWSARVERGEVTWGGGGGGGGGGGVGRGGE